MYTMCIIHITYLKQPKQEMSASCYSGCLKEGGGRRSSIHQSKQTPLSVLQPESGSKHLKGNMSILFNSSSKTILSRFKNMWISM